MEEFNHGKIEQVNISQEMRDSFLDYSMSVIVSRALPDVKDGLKPVHRRIIYSMLDLGMTPDKPHRKSARIVGDVIAKYHPHGDTAVYDSMVRMAQDFSYRYPLVDGHGNFGSIDGDGAAAMRYTEARMSKISLELVRDLYKETIDWTDNYDGELKEPSVLPCKIPNLLVNGSMGIAVGMATNIPPHNLTEAIDATIAIMENPEITVVELMDQYISGPDFPTGAYILGRSGIKQAYETGRGSVIIRSKADIEDRDNGKKRIVIKELPYQVNKSSLVEKIAALVRDKQVEGITSLNDESNRDGIKIVIDVKKDAQAEVILNQLYRLTPLQTSFGVNSIVLVGKTPRQVTLKELLKLYANHQIDVVRRATMFDLDKALKRAHIVEGLKIAIDHIDAIIALIRNSKDPSEAIEGLVEKFGLDEIQAKAIMDMQFKRLTGLERDKILFELESLLKTIEDLRDILNHEERIIAIVKDDLLMVKEKYGDKRRTEIIDGGLDVEDEDLIPVEDVIISKTTNNYIKRIPIDTYKTQNRGGRGIKGMSVNNDDVIDEFISMSTHDHLLLFSNFGKVYRIKGYKIPEATRISKGIPIVNIIPLDKGEMINSMVPYKSNDDENDVKYLFFVTKNGLCKRTAIEEFESIRQNGKIAIVLKDDDELVGVKATSGNSEIIIGASNGKAVRFNESDVRVTGRNSSGVCGMNIEKTDHIVGIASDSNGNEILVVSENGYGKRSKLEDYRMTKRGAKGVKTININEKNGPLVSLKAVNGDEDCMIMTNDGIIIRINVDKIGVYGRVSQGVRLIKPNENCVVSTVAIVEHEEEVDEAETVDKSE
ncbi:MAG: DNA gyrase subunit A [Erysipelotrichaceae bacterium]|nr:DNA gyrase subunit A [Erysipelotrichaceae bacterium]